MAEPLQVVSGDTVTWTRVQADYPASAGWVLTYYVATGPEDPAAIVATPSGADYSVTLAPSWPAGNFPWTARVSKAGEMHVVGRGRFQVLPDPTQARDPRTLNEIYLQAVEDLLVGRMSESVMKYALDKQTSAEHIPHVQLVALRAHYQAAVRIERGGAVLSSIPGGRW